MFCSSVCSLAWSIGFVGFLAWSFGSVGFLAWSFGSVRFLAWYIGYFFSIGFAVLLLCWFAEKSSVKTVVFHRLPFRKSSIT